jgi:hypothetical protein
VTSARCCVALESVGLTDTFAVMPVGRQEQSVFVCDLLRRGA